MLHLFVAKDHWLADGGKRCCSIFLFDS